MLILLGASLFASPQSGAAESVDDLVRQLKATMVESETAHREIAEEIARASPERRALMMRAIGQVIEDALAVPQPRSRTEFCLVNVASGVLEHLSDEKAIMAAFGSRLIGAGFEFELPMLIALSRCRDPKAVEVIAELGRLRLEEMRAWLPDLTKAANAEQRRRQGDTVISLLHAMEALTFSKNSSGKDVARDLRNRFVKLIEHSPNRGKLLEYIESRIDVGLQSHPRGNISKDRGGADTSMMPSEMAPRGKLDTSVTLTQSRQKQGRSSIGTAIAAVVAGVAILGLLIWFRRNK